MILNNSYLKISLLLTLAGTLFAGYLSAIKYFTGVCAFGEPCPFFLGYPSCWFGFGMFFIMFIAVVSGLWDFLMKKTVNNILIVVSLVGILFSDYFTLQELASWLTHGEIYYTLIIPTCAYGLIFYLIIFAISISVSLNNE